MEWIRMRYGVPAKRGMRVKYYDMFGKIVGSKGKYLRIRLDGEDNIMSYHPTWNITYYDGNDNILKKFGTE